MHLSSSFLELLLSLGPVMTAPTFRNWVQLLSGWLFAPRRTITGMLIAANIAGRRHHSAFHRVFAEGRWSLDVLGLTVLKLALTLHPKNRPIFLSLDDTLARKRGRKIYGVGMHHDPLISSRKTAIVNRAHSWVIMGSYSSCRLRRASPIRFRSSSGCIATRRRRVATVIARGPNSLSRCSRCSLGPFRTGASTCWRTPHTRDARSPTPCRRASTLPAAFTSMHNSSRGRRVADSRGAPVDLRFAVNGFLLLGSCSSANGVLPRAIPQGQARLLFQEIVDGRGLSSARLPFPPHRYSREGKARERCARRVSHRAKLRGSPHGSPRFART